MSSPSFAQQLHPVGPSPSAALLAAAAAAAAAIEPLRFEEEAANNGIWGTADVTAPGSRDSSDVWEEGGNDGAAVGSVSRGGGQQENWMMRMQTFLPHTWASNRTPAVGSQAPINGGVVIPSATGPPEASWLPKSSYEAPSQRSEMSSIWAASMDGVADPYTFGAAAMKVPAPRPASAASMQSPAPIPLLPAQYTTYPHTLDPTSWTQQQHQGAHVSALGYNPGFANPQGLLRWDKAVLQTNVKGGKKTPGMMANMRVESNESLVSSSTGCHVGGEVQGPLSTLWGSASVCQSGSEYSGTFTATS